MSSNPKNQIPDFELQREKSSWSTIAATFSFGRKRWRERTCSAMSFKMRCLSHSSRSQTVSQKSSLTLCHLNQFYVTVWSSSYLKHKQERCKKTSPTTSAILPSRNCRSVALSPQNFRNSSACMTLKAIKAHIKMPNKRVHTVDKTPAITSSGKAYK